VKEVGGGAMASSGSRCGGGGQLGKEEVELGRNGLQGKVGVRGAGVEGKEDGPGWEDEVRWVSARSGEKNRKCLTFPRI
jgi:hypothetical protein